MFGFKKKPAEEVYRYERKYLIEHVTFAEINRVCLLHPKGFQPIFAPRTINNIYFDTVGFRDYVDNVEGEQHRVKVRIRWYGELLGYKRKPVLEYKIKDGLMGYKDSYTLSPFSLDEQFSREKFLEILETSKIPLSVKHELSSLQPTLLNQYDRHYYMSFDKKFRLTVDNNLHFHKISYNNPVALERSFKRNAIVLEMKYATADDDEARNISTFFPFPLTKNSKYIEGIDRLFT